MNASNAKDYLPFVQALANGKTIQMSDVDEEGGWTDMQYVKFDEDPERYRIKPELKEFWIAGGKVYSAADIEQIKKCCPSFNALHVREVAE